MSINPSGLQGTPIDPFHNDQVHGGRSQRRRERLMSGAHREVNLVQEDLSSSPSCNNTSSGGQTWLEFLRDTRTHDNGEPSSQQQLDTRRSSMMALDRKRRLTGSLDESARRRAASGGIYRHGHPYGLATDSHTNLVSRVGGPSPHWGSTTTDSPLRDVTSPPTPPPHPSMRGRSSASRRDSAVREYVRPLWQPDSEVTKCPICGTQFTFWYRKHHCRKCGRVVCASCSPHRITIPHQFIVQPPNSTTDTATTPTDETGVEVIDLTEDDSGSRPRTMSNPNPPPEDHLNDPPNPALGGGAEVRLCNPCVPDPNPNPPQPYRSLFATQGAPTVPSNYHAPGYLDRPSTRNPHSWNPNQGGPSGARAPSYMRGEEYRRQHGLFPEDSDSSARGAEGLTIDGPSYGSGSRFLHRPLPTPGSSAPPYYPPPFNGSHPMHRHQASESSSANSRHRNSPPYPPSQAPPAPQRPRPIREEDACPICRLELPPRDPGGSETAREAHVQSCIDRYTTPSSLSSTPQPTPPNAPTVPSARSTYLTHTRQPSRPMAYVSHFATEKDCVAEDGSERECSICLVEFEVADELAVLECLCKFHKVCIRAWLDRSGNRCPLHKLIWELEAGGSE